MKKVKPKIKAKVKKNSKTFGEVFPKPKVRAKTY